MWTSQLRAEIGVRDERCEGGKSECEIDHIGHGAALHAGHCISAKIADAA